MSSFIHNNEPFQSKVVVDEKGKQVAENYSGRKFQLVTKEEVYSKTERLKRALLGTAAVILTLGIAFFASQSVRDLLCKSKKTIQVKIPYNPSKAQSNNSSEIDTKQKDQKQIKPFPKEEVRKQCKLWIDAFYKNFNPNEISTTNFDEIYREDVSENSIEDRNISDIFYLIWKFESGSETPLPTNCLPNDPWHSSIDEYGNQVFENSKDYPGYAYTFLANDSLDGNPAAHFLSVSANKEMQAIIKDENLDELEVVDQSLIALKSKEEIKIVNELCQPYYFVVKSKKMHLMSELETLSKLSSYPQDKQIKIATQLLKLKSLSKKGTFNPSCLRFNKDTNKLVLSNTGRSNFSMFLDEKSETPGQYEHTNKLKQLHNNRGRVLKIDLRSFQSFEDTLPVFKQVGETMSQLYEEKLSE